MKAEFITPAEVGNYHNLLIASGDSPASNVVASVGIADGEDLLTRVDIVASAGYSCFQSVRCSDGLVYVGFGQHVFVVDIQLNQIRRQRLDGYFGHLYDANDLEKLDSRFSVLATSASELLAYGRKGDLLWKRSGLGIDGVVMDSVNSGLLNGQGEWDPPGGWRPFTVIEKSGDLVR